MKFVLFLFVTLALVFPKTTKAESHGVAVQTLLGAAVLGSDTRANADTVTPVDLGKGDLSGTWKLIGEEKGQKHTFQFKLKKATEKKTHNGKEIQFYPLEEPGKIFQKAGDKGHYLGFFVTYDERKKLHRIQWVMKRDSGDIKLENTMVLKQEGNTLVLGGDHEDHELSRLTKIADAKVEPVPGKP